MFPCAAQDLAVEHLVLATGALSEQVDRHHLRQLQGIWGMTRIATINLTTFESMSAVVGRLRRNLKIFLGVPVLLRLNWTVLTEAVLRQSKRLSVEGTTGLSQKGIQKADWCRNMFPSRQYGRPGKLDDKTTNKNKLVQNCIVSWILTGSTKALRAWTHAFSHLKNQKKF